MGLLQDKLSKFRLPQLYMERGVYPYFPRAVGPGLRAHQRQRAAGGDRDGHHSAQPQMCIRDRGFNVLHKGGDLKSFYQMLTLKVGVTHNTFVHVGYCLKDFQTPNYLMLGVGFQMCIRDRHWFMK